MEASTSRGVWGLPRSLAGCRGSTISLFDICFKIENRTSTHTNFQKRGPQAFACLLFFILCERLSKDIVNKPRRIHLCYFYSLRGIILRLQKELSDSGFENMFKITKRTCRACLKQFIFLFPFLNFKTF